MTVTAGLGTNRDDEKTRSSRPRAPEGRLVDWSTAGVAAATGLVLAALSGRYGYHRDELYFVQAGRHLAWGYPDQPPLVPVLARGMTLLAPRSLVVLRLPSTLAAAMVVMLGGLTARELGARRSGQVFASVSTALCGFVLAVGHLLSTATFALLGCSLTIFLLVRVLQGGDQRLWLAAGLTTGVTLQANLFPGLVLATFALAVVTVGPRDILRTRWPWLAAVIAAAVAAPYLVWQARNGLPQLDIAHSIAAGGSTSSVSRPLLLPFEALQAGPGLVLLWLPGLVMILRYPRLRSLGFAFLLLQVALLATGGKTYYASGFFPLLLAAGAQPVLDRARISVPAAIAALSIPGVVFTLPVLPMRSAGVAVAVNPDVGETIGWHQFAHQVAAAYGRLPSGAGVLAQTYGEAGALDRFGGPLGLPRAHSGHNGYADWGMPAGRTTMLTVGVPEPLLRASCRGLQRAGTIENRVGIDNEEVGKQMFVCTPNAEWRTLWPRFRHLS